MIVVSQLEIRNFFLNHSGVWFSCKDLSLLFGVRRCNLDYKLRKMAKHKLLWRKQVLVSKIGKLSNYYMFRE